MDLGLSTAEMYTELGGCFAGRAVSAGRDGARQHEGDQGRVFLQDQTCVFRFLIHPRERIILRIPPLDELRLLLRAERPGEFLPPRPNVIAQAFRVDLAQDQGMLQSPKVRFTPLAVSHSLRETFRRIRSKVRNLPFPRWRPLFSQSRDAAPQYPLRHSML
jgi:hypothetical protein